MPIYMPKTMPDINLLLKYWQLKNTEIWLAKSHFWAQNNQFPQTRIFFSENLLMSLASFIHVYLHAKNQSQILIY